MEPTAQLLALAKSFTLKKLPNSEIEFTGEVPFEALEAHRAQALKTIAAELTLPGFRKGHVPQDLAVKNVGEVAVLEEAVQEFLQDFYPSLVTEHKLDVVGRPDIRVTKLAPGNPVELSIRATLYPEVILPKDWKNIAEKVPIEPVEEVKEEDVTKTLESLRQDRKTKGEDGAEVVPELNDAFARSVGSFENVEALKAQVRKGVGEEKERAAKEKRRGKIIDTLLAGVKIEVPRIFVESELEKIISQMKEDVARFGVTYDDYLKQINKTEETLRDEFREQAKKRATMQLALNKIASEEKVEPEEEAVEREMKHALEHFPKAKPELVRIHIETVLRNEKVLQLLEKAEK